MSSASKLHASPSFGVSSYASPSCSRCRMSAPLPLPHAPELPARVPAAGRRDQGEGQAVSTRRSARLDEVTDDDVDDTVTMEELVEPGDDRVRWQDGQGVEITAYVVERARRRPGELQLPLGQRAPTTTRSSSSRRRRARATRAHRVFAVVTPQWRAAAAADRVDWSTGAPARPLPPALGHRARLAPLQLRGGVEWRSTRRSIAGPNVTRATAWEIHPVTAIELERGRVPAAGGGMPRARPEPSRSGQVERPATPRPDPRPRTRTRVSSTPPARRRPRAGSR